MKSEQIWSDSLLMFRNNPVYKSWFVKSVILNPRLRTTLPETKPASLPLKIGRNWPEKKSKIFFKPSWLSGGKLAGFREGRGKFWVQNLAKGPAKTSIQKVQQKWTPSYPASRCGRPVESEKNDTKFTWKWFIEECGHVPVFVMCFFWVGGGGGKSKLTSNMLCRFCQSTYFAMYNLSKTYLNWKIWKSSFQFKTIIQTRKKPFLYSKPLVYRFTKVSKFNKYFVSGGPNILKDTNVNGNIIVASHPLVSCFGERCGTC